MVRFAQLVLTVALLAGPAYAADLAFTCSGAFKPSDEKEPPRTISNETLFIASRWKWYAEVPFHQRA